MLVIKTPTNLKIYLLSRAFQIPSRGLRDTESQLNRTALQQQIAVPEKHLETIPESYAREGVPVDHNVSSRLKRFPQFRQHLPSVGREKQVNHVVIQLRGPFQVFVDGGPDLCGPRFSQKRPISVNLVCLQKKSPLRQKKRGNPKMGKKPCEFSLRGIHTKGCFRDKFQRH